MEDRGLLNNQISKDIEIDVSIPKIAGLGLASTAAAFGAGLLFNAFLMEGALAYAIGASILAILFLALFFLNTLFIKTAWVANVIVLAESMAFVVGVHDTMGSATVLGGLIMCAVLISAAYIGREYLENFMRIRLWQVGRITIARAIIALAVFISMVSYSNIENIVKNQQGFFVSVGTFERVLQQSVALVQNWIPELDFAKPIGKVIEDVAMRQVQQNEVANKLPEAAQKQLIVQTKEELQNRIAAYFGVGAHTIDLGDSTSEEIYELTAQKFNGLDDENKQKVASVIAIIIFFTIVGIGLPLRLCVTLLAIILYEILLGMGFARVTLEGRSREIIMLE